MPDQKSLVLDNGLTVVFEPMSDVQSASLSLLVPAGSVYDSPGKNGTASILSDLITRGAGDRETVELSVALDNLGVQRDESVGSSHLTFSAATLADNLPAALELYADIVLRPHLPDDQCQSAKEGIRQSLNSIEDEPRQKVIIELRRRCYDLPWGLPPEGSLDDLDGISADDVRTHYQKCFRPDETILGVAGNIDCDELGEQITRLFGDWRPREDPLYDVESRTVVQEHIEHDSSQVHIGIAYDAVPYCNEDYYAAWASVGILSGGMSSRLFTEVRERRGLCYAISASLSGLRSAGRVLCYAGTTVERAQETLDVTLKELTRLGENIEQSELDRCKARAKSSQIMQQESTIARSSAIARDWYHLGRIVPLDEVRQRIDSLTIPNVLDYIEKHPARDFTVLTIGPQPLEVSF